MAVWSIIKKSELEGSSYIAPEFYHPDKLKSQKLINKIGITRISNEFDNIKNLYNLSKTTKLSEKRIKIFDLTDAMGNLLKEGIDIKNIEDIGSTKKIVKNNDLIISRLRSYLREIALVHYDDFSQKLVSTEFIVLRQRKETKYSPQFLLIYLLTSEIQSILHWSQTGTQHPRFDEEVLFNLPLPNFSEFINDITEKVNESIILFEDSKLLYSQAEQILLEELGLKDLDLKDDLFYTTTLKEVKDNNRMDPEYYVPKHEKLIEHIFSFNYILLGKLAKFKKGVEPGSDKYFKTGKPFIRVSNLSEFEIINNNQKYLENNLYMQLKKSYEPKKGEILLSKDATPGVAYVLKESIEGIISSGILRLEVASSIKKEYLALIINSQIGQMQMKRDSGGSIINHWKIEEIKNLKVPLLADDTQEKIDNLCCESFLKRKQAKQLLEQAKHKVEEMIEKEAGVK